MSDVSFGIKLTADGKQLVGEVAAASAAVDKLGASAQRAQSQAQQFAKSNEAWRQNMAGVTAAMRETSTASAELSRDTQRILDRYDPLGTKLRSLQSDFALLRKEMGNSSSDAAIKGFQGLEDEIGKTKVLMGQAGVAVDGHGKAMTGLGLNTSYARRELLVMGHEAMNGNFSRMPGSFMALAGHSNILPALLNPVTLGIAAIGVAAGALAIAAVQGRKEMDAMNNALAVTGNYAGLTRGGMESLSASVAANGHITIGTSKDIVTALVASGRIGAESIGTIANLTSSYAKATGQDISKIAPEMVKLFSDPLKGAEELNRSMHFLTVTDMEHIRTLEQLGKTQEAQLFLAQKVTGHMPQQEANLGTLSKAWHMLGDAISGTADALMNIGKHQTLEAELAAKSAQMVSEFKSSGRVSITTQNEVNALNGLLSAQNKVTAATSAASAANEQNAKSWDAVKSSNHIEDLKTQLELQKLFVPANAAQEIAKREAIQKTGKEIADAYRAQGAEARTENQTEIAFQEKLHESTLKYAASDIDAQLKLGKISQQQHDAQMLGNALEMNASKQLYETQMMGVKGLTAEQQKQHANNLTLLQEEAGKIANDGKNKLLIDEKKLADEKLKQYADIQKSVESLGKTEIASLDRSIAAQRLHNAEIGKTPEQIALVKAGIDELAIKQNETDASAIRGAIDSGNVEKEYIPILASRAAALDEIIARQKTLRDGYVTGAALEAENAANKKRLADFKQFSNEIDRSLTDALMRGFQHGESFGQNFVKSLQNTLKTAALKVAVQAIVNPIMGGVQGAFSGMSATGSASGGGAMDYLSAGQTIWSGFSGGMAASGASLAQSLGFSNFAGGMAGAGAGTTVEEATAGLGAAGGAGAAVATAMPYIAAAYAAYSLFGGLFGGGGDPAYNTGNSQRTFGSTGAILSSATDNPYGNNANADAFVSGMQSSYMRAAMQLGITASSTNFALGGNADSKSQNFVLSGGVGSNAGYQSAFQAKTDAAMQLEASRAVFAALKGSQLPDYLRGVFNNLNASTATQQQISDTLAYAQSLKTMREQLNETRTPLEIATAQMTNLTAEFHTSAATFKTDFVAAIDAGINQQTIARWQALGQAIDQVTQATAAATAATLSAAQTVYGTAKTDLMAAYTRESDAAKQLADNMRGFATSFSALRNSLNLGALSTLSPAQKYQEAQRAFDDVSRRAQLGDQAAMAQMEGVSQSFLQASRDYNASSAAYAADFSRVSAALEAGGGVASRQADIATQQVTLLQSQLSALGLINTSVLSIGDALLAYRQSATAVNAAGGTASGGYTSYSAAAITGYVSANHLTSVQQIYDAAVAGNADPYQVGAAYGLDRAATDARLAANGIKRLPGYADGSNVIPIDHIAMVHKGEEIKPARYVEQDRAERAETNALLREVIAELRADKVQRGSAAAETLIKLEVVADKLDGNKRELARAA